MQKYKVGFYLDQKFGGGGGEQGRESWTNGPPWWPKGVGAGGGKHGKLKHKLILLFP